MPLFRISFFKVSGGPPLEFIVERENEGEAHRWAEAAGFLGIVISPFETLAGLHEVPRLIPEVGSGPRRGPDAGGAGEGGCDLPPRSELEPARGGAPASGRRRDLLDEDHGRSRGRSASAAENPDGFHEEPPRSW